MNSRSQVNVGPVSSGERPPTLEDILIRAIMLHRAQQLDEAENLYRRILATAPDHARGLHLLGVLLAQSGRFDQAADLIEKATRLAPGDAEAHYNLGSVLQHEGRAEDAQAAFQRTIDLDANHALAHNNLGVALTHLRRPDEALAAYRRAILLKPDYAEAHNNLGVTLQNLKQTDEARTAYDRALDLKPDYAEAHGNLGSLLMDLGHHDDALAACRRAIALKPDHADLLNNLGNTLKALGQYDDAMAAYRAALVRKPDFATAHLNLSLALQELGRAVEARDEIDRALTIDPESAHAWYIRSDLKTFVAGDPDIDGMEALLASADIRRLDLEERMHLTFALGKAWMDVQDADRAFVHLHQGNRLKRGSVVYDARAAADLSAEIARCFQPEQMRRLAGSGNPSDLPIFVIGMPRSGTTLIEQILASHPDIHGTGELPLLEDAIKSLSRPGRPATGYPQMLQTLSAADLTALGLNYVERLSALAPGKRRIVDKMLGNFQFCGLIHLMLPNARIVHCQRDAIDTCLSCYAKKFTRGQNFTYDLHELGSSYRSYETLMAHWRELLPADRFIEVQYEDVVDDLEGESRRLIDFCGLDWDTACLDFHTTRRPVRTASFNQVRQPLYRTSVGRWKPYARHLEPLLAALGAGAEAGSPEPRDR